MRPYQEEAVSNVIRLQHEVKRQLILAATGAGKTIISSEIMRRINKKTIFLAHRDELIRQAADKAQNVWPEASIGICKGNENDVHAQVVVASVQTIMNRLSQFLEPVELMIIDECHHSVSASYKKVIAYFYELNPHMLLVGVTATPDRSDGKSLGDVFDQIVYEISMLDLIKMGFLVHLRGKRVETGVDLSKIATKMGDYDETQLSIQYNTDVINELVVQTYLNECEDRLAVAFCCNVAHSKDLAASFRRFGIPAESIDGSMKVDERRDILDRFAKGEIRVLMNVMVLTEGFDCPEVSAVLLVRPTQSRGLYTQMAGRGLRLSSETGKKDCLIIDFVGNTTNHQLVTLLSILGNEEDQKRYKRERESKEKEEDSESEINTDDFIRMQETQKAFQAAFEDQFSQPMVDIELLPKVSEYSWNPLPIGYSLNMGKGSVLLLPSRTEGEDKGWDVWAFTVETESFRVMSPYPFTCLGEAQHYAEALIEKRKNDSFVQRLIQKNASWKDEPVSEEQVKLLKRYKLPIPACKGEASLLLDRMKITEKLVEYKIIS